MQSSTDSGMGRVGAMWKETVKTVKRSVADRYTPLKRGVSESAVAGTFVWLMACVLTSATSYGAETATVTTNLAKPSPVVPRTNLVSEFQIKRGFRIELVASAPMV